MASAFSFLKYLFIHERVSVIIPCYNEAVTVGAVVGACRNSPIVEEIIVVDDGSWDSSAQAARAAGAKVVRHRKNKGKGEAILSGAKAAKFPVLVFLDADFKNASQEALESLALPILRHETNMCKANFGREAGRVTELAAKPLLEFLFTDISLSQPLSGQFAIRKELLGKLDVSVDWGVDVSIVLGCLKRGEKILEVDIGDLEHKHRPLHELAHTSRQVMKTILQQAGFHAHRHKLIVFDFDGVLVSSDSTRALAHIARIPKAHVQSRPHIKERDAAERPFLRKCARILSRKHTSCLEKLPMLLKPRPYSAETLLYLRRMGYKIAVVAFSLRQPVVSLFPPLLFDAIICPSLGENSGHFTGGLIVPPYRSSTHVFSKGKAVRALMRKWGIKKHETIAVGSPKSGNDFFGQAGMRVSFSALPNTRRISSITELLIIAA